MKIAKALFLFAIMSLSLITCIAFAAQRVVLGEMITNWG
jgi:hypothetical protein